MQNQIYRGVQHAVKTESNRQNNSNLTYRGVSYAQGNTHRAAQVNAQMNYRGLSYSRS